MNGFSCVVSCTPSINLLHQATLMTLRSLKTETHLHLYSTYSGFVKRSLLAANSSIHSREEHSTGILALAILCNRKLILI